MIRDMIYANMGRPRQPDSDDTAYNVEYMSSLASIRLLSRSLCFDKKVESSV